MRFTALRLLIALMVVCTSAMGLDEAPHILRVPALGLRYDIHEKVFDRLPSATLRFCPTMVDNDNMRGVFWIYASTRVGNGIYYIIGGYGIRSDPHPGFPRYEPLDLGTVLHIEGKKCTIFGDAQEVFQTRLFEETPQNVLQELAIDLKHRASSAWGGEAQLRSALRRQHRHPETISPEMAAAFTP